MKKFTVLLAGVFVLTSVMPVLAQDGDEFMFEMTQMRYRFDHEVASVDGSGDLTEYFDDDFDTEFMFSRGEVQIFFDLEVADTNMGGDIAPQNSYADALGDYGIRWSPESLADSEFKLELGEFNGMSFGRNINNDDGNRGTIVLSWKMGSIGLALGYSKIFEGNTDDDIEGDEHQFRVKADVPLGESGFNMAAYAAMYSAADLIFAEAVPASEDGTDPGSPEFKGDRNIMLAAVEFSGTVSNLDIYSEVGFATGTDEQSGTEVDLSGFYAMGGASIPVGQVTLGFEGGFASGDDDATDDKDEGFTAVNSDFWLGQIMHDEELITRTNGSGGGLSNIIYALATVAMSPTEKLSLDAGFLYLKPVEEVNGAENYGMEVYGGASYALADFVTYSLYWGVAMADEDFVDESLYQITNRLEFDIK
jgi:hypothetical protein